MILNIKEMTRRNLASAKAEMFKISTSRPSCKLPSVCEHYLCNYFPFPFFFILSFILFFSLPFLVHTFVVYCQPNIHHQEHHDMM